MSHRTVRIDLRTGIIIIVISLIANLHLRAQQQTKYWYFGYRCGLEFQNPNPLGLMDGEIDTREGCSSISDSLGNLLFYTDGKTVWNRYHNAMPNGTGLTGGESSAQSSLIVPAPGSINCYYIFTVDESENNLQDGFRYSIVDMTQINGNGNVSSIYKNVLVNPNSAENLCAVHHINGKDIWIIVHEKFTKRFVSYLLTTYGLVKVPRYNILMPDSTHEYNVCGHIKTSPDAKKIAYTQGQSDNLYLYKYNNFNNHINSPVLIHSTPGIVNQYDHPFYYEFSPDSRKIFYSTELKHGSAISTRGLFQADIRLHNESFINSSAKQIFISDTDQPKDIQIGLNKKLYISFYADDFLGVINYPNKDSSQLGFSRNGTYLPASESRLGLPNFYRYYSAPFQYRNTCFERTTHFFVNDSLILDSIKWNFGEPSSGPSNISKEYSTSHFYSQKGNYEVSVIKYYNGVKDSLTMSIMIHDYPQLDLGPDKTICDTDSLMLDAFFANSIYSWSTGDTGSYINVSAPGAYSVVLTNGCASVTDTINIYTIQAPTLIVHGDTAGCSGDSLLIQAQTNCSNVHWSTNDTIVNLYVKHAGKYYAVATNNCGTVKDSIQVSIYPYPQTMLRDTMMCEKDTLYLYSGNNSAVHLWSTGDTLDHITVFGHNDSVYCLRLEKDHCKLDTCVSVIVNTTPHVQTINNTEIARGEHIQLYAYTEPDCNFKWTPSDWLSDPYSQAPVATPLESVVYSVEVINSNNCRRTDIVFVKVIDIQNINIYNAFTPNGDGVNDVWNINNIEYYPDCSINIFNLWGMKVFESIGYVKPWDGRYRGEKLPSGTYYYVIELGEREKSYMGSVTIIY